MASITLPEIAPMTSSIKKLMGDSLKQEDVCKRLNDEIRTLKATNCSTVRAATAAKIPRREWVICD